MAGIDGFNKTTEATQLWVSQVVKELNLDDRHKAFQGLRTTLHVLRDRFTVGEAANLGAELPILLASTIKAGNQKRLRLKPGRKQIFCKRCRSIYSTTRLMLTLLQSSWHRQYNWHYPVGLQELEDEGDLSISKDNPAAE
jgi:hypothetical protein